MNKEILVSKWLDSNLSPEELEQFKKLPEYKEYIQLSEYAQAFKAPTFDSTAGYNDLMKRKPRKQSPKRWMQIAAVVAILISGAYFLMQSGEVTLVNTQIAQQETIVLPDNSEVILNAKSSLTYDAATWQTNRTVTLEGEAFFKVAKGSAFTVNTSLGEVQVLGTQFNVQERKDTFSVSTFEGLVHVSHTYFTGNIAAGKSVYIHKENVSQRDLDSEKIAPTWIEKISTFDSVPFSTVIAEMERQYDITIEASTIQINQLYTGSFTHTNLSQALETITIPMGLKFSKTGNRVTLEKK